FTIFRVPTSVLSLEPFSEDQGRSAVHHPPGGGGTPPASSLAPPGFVPPLPPPLASPLVPVFKPARLGGPRAAPRAPLGPGHAVPAPGACHDRGGGVSPGVSRARAWAVAAIRVGPRPEPIGGPALAVPHPTGAHRRPPSASLPAISSTL